VNNAEQAMAIVKELAEEASTYCHEAADAIQESVSQSRNPSIDWILIAQRRLRAALALIGGLE
jgi:hypothetical protein